MDKKSKIFFTIFFSIIFVVAAMSFFKFYVLKDYYIRTEIDCDPATEKCFIYECDPAVDSECPENPAERLSYYKLIEKKASAIPLCGPNEADCPPLVCQAGEDCQEILCDETTRTGDEVCSNPLEFLNNQAGSDGGSENENVNSNENSGPKNTDSENPVLDNPKTAN